jgi:predicted DNA-binding WGR domain protein
MLTDTAPHARLVVSRQLLLKSSDHFAHSGKHALYGNPPRWHLITPNKPAPKGAPIAHDPAAIHATPHQVPAEHVAQLKLPDTNSNAPSFNKQIDKLVGFASTGNAAAILGMALGTNTYAKKAAVVANFLLGKMGVHEHVVVHGQKAGSHAALQPPAASDGLQEPGPLAPLAQHVKDSLDQKAADGDVEFIKLVAANNPEHQQIVAYAQQKLAELGAKTAPVKNPLTGSNAFKHIGSGDDTSGKAGAHAAAKEWLAANPGSEAAVVSALSDMGHQDIAAKFGGKSAAGPLVMPAFEEGKTTAGVVAYYEKVAQKIIDHGLAGNAAVLEGLKADGLKPNAKGKVTNTWLGKTANSKKLLALHAAAMAHASGGSGAAAKPPLEQQMDDESIPLPSGIKTKIDAMDAGELSALVATHSGPGGFKKILAYAQAKMAAAPNTGPKEGDTKPGADGKNLVFKDGRWHKYVDADEHGELPPVLVPAASAAPATIATLATPLATPGTLSAQQLQNLQSIPWYKHKLPAENTNAKSHNAAVAKIEAMAFAGDTAGLQAFIDAKGGAKQTYAKKQVLTAQTALAGLQEPGATAAVPVEPAPAPAAKPPVTADTPLVRKQQAALDTMSLADLEAVTDSPGLPANVQAWIDKKIPELKQAAKPKTVSAHKTILHNTLPGHSKSWSVYVAPNASGGFDMVTEHGKIGGTQQKTVKSYPTHAEAGDAAAALKNTKFKKGYVQQPTDYAHTVPAPGAAAQPTNPKDGDTKQGADGMLVLKNGHWVKVDQEPKALTDWGVGNITAATAGYSKPELLKVLKPAAVAGDAAAIQKWKADNAGKLPNTQKLADKLLAAMGAPSAPGAAPAPSKYPSMDSWVQTGPQGGSNPGGRFRDADGVEWYCKFPPDENHAHSEVLAAKLYEAAGLSAQDAKLVTKNGKVGIASRWAEVTKVGAEGLKSTPGALSGFVVDAWLANWDVVGMGYDNLQAGADGRAMRVDAGGSLQYRAQGEAKPFGHKVEEIDSMRDAKKNPQAAAVFGALTAADMTASAKKVLAVSDDQIHDLVMAHGPGDVTKKAELIDALIARKEDIAKRFPKAVPKTKVKPKPDPTKLKVTADQLPKPHDFKNWKGAGQGLSSKGHVNEANQAAEQALLDTALQGNLIALKDYHYDALDKETGAVVGKKPISDHPSNHVKTYWSDLVSTLSFIAYPPEALKEFKAIVATSIAKVSDAFKAHKYGTATKHVEANSRLAFWIALGKTKPAESLLPPGASLDFQSSPAGQPKVTPQMSQQAQAAYQTLTSARPVKRFINGIQASGSYNDNFRDGRMVTTDGWDAAAMALDAYSYATEKPEGFELYKWISFPGDMGKQMLAAPPGTVFQNPGSMCCSTGPTGTQGFGSDRVRIRYAKGAKAVDSFGSGNHPGEKEITTLPGQRFVILKCHKVMCPVKGKERIELDVLMLPPDPTYVSELEALKGKHGGKS